MLAAKIVGAGKTGFGPAVLAVILQACLSILIRQFVPSDLIALLAAVTVGSIIYSLTLDTTILRGFAVSILVVVIFVAAMLLFAGTFTIFENLI